MEASPCSTTKVSSVPETLRKQLCARDPAHDWVDWVQSETAPVNLILFMSCRDLEPPVENQQRQAQQLFDPAVIAKLKFQQSAERKAWQGINVQHSGIPGTSNLNVNERILMFQPEKVSNSPWMD